MTPATKIPNVAKLAIKATATAIFISISSTLPSNAFSFTSTLMDVDGGTPNGSVTVNDLEDGGVAVALSIGDPIRDLSIAEFVFFLLDGSLLENLFIRDFTSNLGSDIGYGITTGGNACNNFFGVNNLFCNDPTVPRSNVALRFPELPSDEPLENISFTVDNAQARDFYPASFDVGYTSVDETHVNENGQVPYYYHGYMGTTSSVFWLGADEEPPVGATPGFP